MRAYDIIKKKRDGGILTESEIRFFIEGVTNGEIADYQTAAFCMAVFLRGMTEEETAYLTFAIRDSGGKLDFSRIKGIRADKHSTGGVGDKTSLVVAPIVASCGVTVAKMSGRGLGHTGGTVDKLEAIPGFRTDLTQEEFIGVAEKTGMAICGQSADLAPADKKLYAVRDVTATVDSIPLIVASIMGKKLAADDDVIVLDVKVGSGAFMKTEEDAERLAHAMVDVGKRAGKKVVAYLTRMDRPLGKTIGNALEVREAIEALGGKGEKDFLLLCKKLSAEMLFQAGKGTREECDLLVEEAIKTGKALDTFAKTVEAQGGDPSCVYHPDKMAVAPYRYELKAKWSGYIVRINAEEYGKASLILGAGRNKKEDVIDYGAGILLNKNTGDFVTKGERIATLFTSKEETFEEAVRYVENGTTFGNERPENTPIILKVIE